MTINSIRIQSYSNLQEIKTLGNGSFGKVKLLYDKFQKQIVVGKFFQTSGEQKKIQDQFHDALREANVLAQLKHKNIVRVLGAAQRSKRDLVIILEYATNGNLETLLHSARDIVLPWKIRARFFAELANALDYLHNHNSKRSYIHGDLKPQNVLLGDKLHVKLADFGSAAIAEIRGATSLPIRGKSNNSHTPFYAPPEYLKDPTVDKLCSMDVYGYGMNDRL